MNIRYTHTNIISTDWKKLATFYQTVFNCIPVPPERDQSGAWLSKGTGVKNAHLRGMHLRMPGYGENGPTLEIFQYDEMLNSGKPVANRKGFGHIAFHVENVAEMLRLALENGASMIGEISERDVEGVGHLTFIYIADPDGNIIELQNWS
ncbi:MAG TPA: VOC family protein [Bacteroidia bacterium]|nr:VOC family protein [Bacteroidia bacterium]